MWFSACLVAGYLSRNDEPRTRQRLTQFTLPVTSSICCLPRVKCVSPHGPLIPSNIFAHLHPPVTSYPSLALPHLCFGIISPDRCAVVRVSTARAWVWSDGCCIKCHPNTDRRSKARYRTVEDRDQESCDLTVAAGWWSEPSALCAVILWSNIICTALSTTISFANIKPFQVCKFYWLN